MNKRVLVTFPTDPRHPYLHKQVVMTSWKLLVDGRYKLHFSCPSHRPFENNLHHIIKDFVAGEFDYWLSIDHDNPPLGNPLDLIELDIDIVGFPTPIWHYEGKVGETPVYWNGYDYDPREDAYRQHLSREGLQEVDAIGTGCFLVARRVFDSPEMRHGAFQRTWNEDGTVRLGADLAFCQRAKRLGFRIYCDYQRPCRHFGEHDLHEIVTAFRGLYEGEKVRDSDA